MVTMSTVRLNIRIPDDLHAELVERAKGSKRSLNSQMIYFLDLSVRFERVLLEAAIEKDLGIKPRKK
jgi:hypothetical protein